MNVNNMDFNGRWEIRGEQQLVSPTYTREEVTDLINRVNRFGSGLLKAEMVESRAVAADQPKRYRALLLRSQLQLSDQNILLEKGFAGLQEKGRGVLKKGEPQATTSIEKIKIESLSSKMNPAYQSSNWETRSRDQIVSPLISEDEATSLKEKINQQNPSSEAFIVTSRGGSGHRVVINGYHSKFQGSLSNLEKLLTEIFTIGERISEVASKPPGLQKMPSDDF